MIGTIGIQGLRIDCIIGAYGHERAQPQPLVVDIELDYDLEAAAGSDTVGDAVNYDDVAADVTELAQRRRYRLIETMAEEVAALLLGRHPLVQTVRLEIRKPGAVQAAACSFVRLQRQRP
jgi:FolB domain-containing protein